MKKKKRSSTFKRETNSPSLKREQKISQYDIGEPLYKKGMQCFPTLKGEKNSPTLKRKQNFFHFEKETKGLGPLNTKKFPILKRKREMFSYFEKETSFPKCATSLLVLLLRHLFLTTTATQLNIEATPKSRSYRSKLMQRQI